MARIEKRKKDVPTGIVVAVITYDLALVAAAVYLAATVTPWCILILIFLATIDDEEVIVEGDSDELERIAEDL